VNLSVEEYLKGTSVGPTIIVTMSGGINERVSDSPQFSSGERVIVFLKQPADGFNIVWGGLEGQLTVVHNENNGIPLIEYRQKIRQARSLSE
jgi:hypothetical protein